MKKIFIVAIALAVFVSCSKDDGVDKVLTSKEKSVSVTIQNSVISGTRATVTGETLNPTPNGGEAGLTKQVGTAAGTEDAADGSTETLVADINQLKILFANQAGQVLHAMPLVNTADDDIHADENGTNEDNNPSEYVPGTNPGDELPDGSGVYEFHRVPEAVTRVAVIRDVNLENAETLVGKTLADIQKDAVDESDRNVDVQSIFLYAEGDLKVSNKCYEDTVNGVTTTYNYYTTILDILPQYTRFELVSVSCDDLGKLNTDVDNPNIATVGLDELQLVKFTIPLNGKEYKKTWTVTENNNWTLYGDACTAETCKAKDIEITADDEQGAAGYAWSWNMAPGKLNLAADSAPMVLDLNADSHHMFVNNTAKTVKVVSLNGNAEFELKKGEVYRMALSFKESNIDKTDDQLCVQATVTINNWKVVLVTPEFATGSSN